MTVAVVSLSLVVVLLGAALLRLALRNQGVQAAAPTESALQLVAGSTSELDRSTQTDAFSATQKVTLDVTGDPQTPTGLHLSFGRRELATIKWNREEPQSRPNLVVSGLLMEAARFVPPLADALQHAGTYTVSFSRSTTQALATGEAVLMTGGRALATDAATRQIIEGAVIVGTASTFSVAWPVLLAGGVAVGAAAYSQHQLQKALKTIDTRLRHIEERQFLDDVGVLMGSQNLAHDLVDAAQIGTIPDQLASELAVARREVERVYFARRQRIEQCLDDIRIAQDRSAAVATGDKVSWAKNVDKSFGNLDVFENETLLYLRSATCRAHLAAATAAVLSVQADPSVAFALLDRTEADLRDSLNTFDRHLKALEDHPPTGYRSGPKSAHRVVIGVRQVIEEEVRLILPLEANDTISMDIEIRHPASVRHMND